MIVSYKYRAYPDATTETRLNGALDTCRWLYNNLLEECNTAREHGFTPTMRGMQARIVTLKEENPFLKGVYSKVLQMVNYTQRRGDGRSANSGSRAHSGIGRSTTTNQGSRSTGNTVRSRSRRSEHFRSSCIDRIPGR